jgi:Zn-dependent protease
MAQAGVLVNVVMFVFNLFPVPPLDGGRIVVGLLPMRQAMAYSRIEPYGFFVVMFLVMVGAVNRIWMQPLMSLTYGAISWLLSPLDHLLFVSV